MGYDDGRPPAEKRATAVHILYSKYPCVLYAMEDRLSLGKSKLHDTRKNVSCT